MTFSWLVHNLLTSWSQLVKEFFMTCLWLVHYFLFSCHDSSIINSWLVHELCIKLLVIVCDLFMTYYLLLTCSSFAHDIFMTCSWIVHYFSWLIHGLFSSSNIISFFTWLCLQALIKEMDILTWGALLAICRTLLLLYPHVWDDAMGRGQTKPDDMSGCGFIRKHLIPSIQTSSVGSVYYIDKWGKTSITEVV